MDQPPQSGGIDPDHELSLCDRDLNPTGRVAIRPATLPGDPSHLLVLPARP